MASEARDVQLVPVPLRLEHVLGGWLSPQHGGSPVDGGNSLCGHDKCPLIRIRADLGVWG